MNEFKGTKGKWEVNIPKYGESNGFASLSTEDGMITCYNGLTKEGAHPKSLANALLISKSPELLTDLNDLVWLIEQGGTIEELQERIKVSKKLIKEATQI
jgi:hypothetical protein